MSKKKRGESDTPETSGLAALVPEDTPNALAKVLDTIRHKDHELGVVTPVSPSQPAISSPLDILAEPPPVPKPCPLWDASNPNASIEELAALASDESVAVRFAVAANPNSDIKLLKTLAADPDWRVRSGVLHHPSVDRSIVANLNKDEPLRRWDIADNETSSIDELLTLTVDPEWWVRLAVATNPTTPLDVLHDMQWDEAQVVKTRVEERISTSGAEKS